MQALRNHTRTLVGVLAIVLAFALLARMTLPTVTATPGQDSPVSTQSTTFPADTGSLGPVPDGIFPFPPIAVCGLRNITFSVAGMRAPLIDVEVSFTMNPPHPWVGDLIVTLFSPSNMRSRTVFSRPGVPTLPFGYSSDLSGQYTFNDSSGVADPDHFWKQASLNPVVPPFPVTYRTVTRASLPINPPFTKLTDAFTDLKTSEVNGTWTLSICDFRKGNTGGAVSDASLKLTGPCKTCPLCKLLSDFDGDGRNDLAVWRSVDHTWYSVDSSTGAPRSVSYIQSTDRIVPGDYDGDGVTDYSVWRPSTNQWFIRYSSGPATFPPAFSLGGAADIRVPRDYDGDGKTDLAVWQPLANPPTWTIIKSTGGPPLVVQRPLALPTDIPVPEDYDGDCKADIAEWRNGSWFIVNSSNNSAVTLLLGSPGDTPVPADYDGDGLADLATYSPTGVWHIRRSSAIPQDIFTTFGGLIGDRPIPGCCDGDGKTDLQIFRPSQSASPNSFFCLRSSNGTVSGVPFGTSGDIPVIGAYILP